MKWNDIPWDETADPGVKGLEFDLQLRENMVRQPQEPKKTA